MKIRKFLSTLLACMLLSSLLPSAEAIDCAIYDAYAAPASVTAHPAPDAGPRSFTTAHADEANKDGGAFHPYVFTVDENASVSARVQMQPALMVLTERSAPLTVPAPVKLEGDGSSDHPYQIGNDAQLEKFRDIANSGNSEIYADLTADIDLAGKSWTPISGFAGVFDGAGHVISGLNVTGGQYAGLFGSVTGDGTLVTRLGVQGSVSASSATGSAFVGGIAGSLTGNASISKCWFVGSVHASVSDSAGSSSAFAGGIVGYSCDRCNVSNCYSVGPARAEAAGDNAAYAGGIAGYCEDNAAVSCCYHAEDNITAAAGQPERQLAGGIVGKINVAPVHCYYLTGTANSGVGDGSKDSASVTWPLSADEFGKTESFIVIDSAEAWDFFDIWFMDDAAARPRLRCEKQESFIEIEISESDIPLGVTREIYFHTPENATGSITVTLSCKEANETFSPVNIKDGKASLNITPRYVGDHTVTAAYSGDDQFWPCESSYEFSVVEVLRADEWGELKSAIQSKNVTIALAGNVTCENQTLSCLEISKNCSVTLDLHSFTIDHGTTNGSIFHVDSGGNLTIMDSIGGGAITGGKATDGGAVYVADGGSLSISNVSFINNTAQSFGGAIFAAPGASLSITDCAFINNTAGYHSAVSLRNADVSISRSVFIDNTADAGVVGSLNSSQNINNVTNCIFVGNKAGGGVFSFAGNENASTDFNWFGQTAKDYTINQDAQAAKAWYFVNITRSIDSSTGQYAFNAALGAYNSTSHQAVKISSENYPLPTIRLDGRVLGADIGTAMAAASGSQRLARGAENNAAGAELMLSRAGYSSVNFTPSVYSTNYTVSFRYPGHPEIYQNLTFVRTIRVNEKDGMDMFTFIKTIDTESGPIAVMNLTALENEPGSVAVVNLTALENGEAVPNIVLANKTATVEVDNQTFNYTITSSGVFEMDLGNVTPGTHDARLTVPGFVPLAVNLTAPKYHTPLNVEVPEYVVIGKDVTIQVAVPDNATGIVTMNIRDGAGYDGTYCANITDGKGAMTVSGLPVGAYTANITYSGDDNYLKNATSISFRIVEKTYTVALSASPPGGGVVTGAGNHTGGTDVTVTATPNPGYDFVNWKEGDKVVSENATYVFPAIANRTLTAVFARKTLPAPAPSYDYAPPAPKETRFDEVDLSKGSLDNFKRSRSYTEGLFSDADPEGWYFENVVAAYEFALMEGMGDGTFGVGASLKLSEALALACRMHNIYYGGSGRFDQAKDENWYTVYEDYATKYGIIQKGAYDLTKDATRAQFAAIISAALPDAALKPINDVGELPDMKADDPRLPAILRLYNAGILTGVDEQGNFRPDAFIPREQIAAMATRVADPALRKAFTLS